MATNNILVARQIRRVSRRELAEKIGVHYNTLRNWELGESDLKAEKLVAISRVLGCTIEELLLVDGS